MACATKELLPAVFLGYANSYRAAADILADAKLESPNQAFEPIYMLYFHAAELGLKAFLRNNGFTTAKLRLRLGHDLVALHSESIKRGLNPSAKFEPHLRNVMSLLHKGNSKEAFRYWVGESTETADLKWVRSVVADLIELVELRLRPPTPPGTALYPAPVAVRVTITHGPEAFGIPPAK
ncbi:hypothetical protein SBBP2_1590001 [Burkholderiales bacterium]|jgi:hypothetical protein|nr:hypothetical protein SBBP2_1590001 [Burkholderiales bacterium]